jgi:predicted thioesterase
LPREEQQEDGLAGVRVRVRVRVRGSAMVGVRVRVKVRVRARARARARVSVRVRVWRGRRAASDASCAGVTGRTVAMLSWLGLG